jgi:predicted mannosyl-3-phosphoglycerate phosphatase (HAD superfamily)
MSIADKLKHAVSGAVFAEETVATTSVNIPPAVPVVAQAKSVPPTWDGDAVSLSGKSPADDHYYQRLFDITNPEGSQALGKVLAVANDLADTIPDRSLRMRAAVKASHVEPGVMLAELNGLLDKLGNEEKFAAKAFQDSTQSHVVESEKAADGLRKEIADRQQRLQDLLTQIETSRSKIAQAKSDFAVAASRRRNELQQLQAEYTAYVR